MPSHHLQLKWRWWWHCWNCQNLPAVSSPSAHHILSIFFGFRTRAILGLQHWVQLWQIIFCHFILPLQCWMSLVALSAPSWHSASWSDWWSLRRLPFPWIGHSNGGYQPTSQNHRCFWQSQSRHWALCQSSPNTLWDLPPLFLKKACWWRSGGHSRISWQLLSY